MNVKKKWLSAIAVAALTLGLGGFVATQASATQPGFICTETGDGWLPKVNNDAKGNTVEVDVADLGLPEGALIDGYCVKAGTTSHIIWLDEPVEVVFVDH